MIRIDNDWQFVFSWTDAFGRGEGAGQSVRLPHTVQEIPLHYCSSSSTVRPISPRSG